jgi:hypothetical protein
VEGKILKEDKEAYSSKAIERFIELTIKAPGGNASFPLSLAIPRNGPIKGIFVNIAFMVAAQDGFRYCPSCPVEEIIDNGFALAMFDYTEASSDDGNFDNGIGAVFPHDQNTGWGKLGIWAYAMSRTADYLLTVDELTSPSKAGSLPLAAIGFSRLGKTSLWAGAQDTRFSYVLPFGSSTAGVAFTRKNSKQTMEELQFHHKHWFCGNFSKYNHNENAMPFDQHFAVACSAPRKFLSAIAQEDIWIDVEKEYLSIEAAAPAWSLSGAQVMPEIKLRHGSHFFSRNDWQAAMAFIEKNQ